MFCILVGGGGKSVCSVFGVGGVRGKNGVRYVFREKRAPAMSPRLGNYSIKEDEHSLSFGAKRVGPACVFSLRVSEWQRWMVVVMLTVEQPAEVHAAAGCGHGASGAHLQVSRRCAVQHPSADAPPTAVCRHWAAAALLSGQKWSCGQSALWPEGNSPTGCVTLRFSERLYSWIRGFTLFAQLFSLWVLAAAGKGCLTTHTSFIVVAPETSTEIAVGLIQPQSLCISIKVSLSRCFSCYILTR